MNDVIYRNYDNNIIASSYILSSWVNHGFLPPHIINGDVVSRVDSQQSFLYHQERYYIFFFEISLPPFIVVPDIVYEGLR